MDDRGYVAQALFDRLGDGGRGWRLLGDSRDYPERAPAEVQLVVPREALAGIPRAVARFCHDLDLQLVQLAPEDSRAWRCVLAWSDEVGRPRFMSIRVCSDYCRGLRRYLRAEDLLSGAAETLFSHGLVDAVETGELPAARAAWLSALWNDDPRGAIERVARFWPDRALTRLIAQAARAGEWGAVRASLPALRRSLRRAVLPDPADIAARVSVLARSLAQPARATIAFMGRESIVRSEVLSQVARDLAPLGLTFLEGGGRAHLRVVFDAGAEARLKNPDLVTVEAGRGVPALVVELEREILRWLECRVERRYPEALVGENPVSARVLQWTLRHRVPGLAQIVSTLLNCSIDCRLGSPILMPYPFGIVIERGARIGSRVTLMHQVSLLGGPTIEDNVVIGPGAKIVGAVRIGRGATIGPNAVVTEDVPSHDTIVVEKRRPDRRSVVNV
jgi:serine O-acetyltransferase